MTLAPFPAGEELPFFHGVGKYLRYEPVHVGSFFVPGAFVMTFLLEYLLSLEFDETFVILIVKEKRMSTNYQQRKDKETIKDGTDFIPITEKIAEAVGLSRGDEEQKNFRIPCVAAYSRLNAEVYSRKTMAHRSLRNGHEESLLCTARRACGCIVS